MASPRTRRVLQELKPQDENSVRLSHATYTYKHTYAYSKRDPISHIVYNKKLTHTHTHARMHTYLKLYLFMYFIHVFRNASSVAHTIPNGCRLPTAFGYASSVRGNIAVWACICRSYAPSRWTSGRTLSWRR